MKSLRSLLGSLVFVVGGFASVAQADDVPRHWAGQGTEVSVVPISVVRRRTKEEDLTIVTPTYGVGLQVAHWFHPNAGLSLGYMLGLLPRRSLDAPRELAHYLDLRFEGRVHVGSSIALCATACPAMVRTKPAGEDDGGIRPVQMALGFGLGVEAGGGRFSVLFER